MAKNGFEFGKYAPLLRGAHHGAGWSLCIGAGASTPAFPDWHTLVRRLVALDTVGSASADDLLRGFSSDALIEAARDRLGMSESEFSRVLVDELYSDIRSEFSPSEFQALCEVVGNTKAVGSTAAKTLNRCQPFLRAVRAHYPNLTALSLAQVLTDLHGTEQAPKSVLSFNAEPLLVGLVDALIYERFLASGNEVARAGELRSVFNIVTHSISARRSGKIPFIFCHGLLPVPDPTGAEHRRDSVDKLVFSESAYLGLANSAFSWQSSVFLEACSTRSIVFIGVSLSDPNMRRWLSWVHGNRIRELRERHQHHGESSTHFWINRRPGSEGTQRWIESAVAHLGVRLIWIDDWRDAGAALRALL